jgi:hypothetical protein
MRQISEDHVPFAPSGPILLVSNPRTSSSHAHSQTDDVGFRGLWQQHGLWQHQSSFLLLRTRHCTRKMLGCRLSHPHTLLHLQCHPTLDRLPFSVTAHQSVARQSVHPSKIPLFPQEEKNSRAGRSYGLDGWAGQLLAFALTISHADMVGPVYNCCGRLGQHGSKIGAPGGLLLLPILYFQDHAWEFSTVMAG